MLQPIPKQGLLHLAVSCKKREVQQISGAFAFLSVLLWICLQQSMTRKMHFLEVTCAPFSLRRNAGEFQASFSSKFFHCSFPFSSRHSNSPCRRDLSVLATIWKLTWHLSASRHCWAMTIFARRHKRVRQIWPYQFSLQLAPRERLTLAGVMQWDFQAERQSCNTDNWQQPQLTGWR